MTSVNTALGTMVNAAMLTHFGAALGTAMFGGGCQIRPCVWAGGCYKPAAPAFTAKMDGEGKAKIDLGDGYTLEVDERNSQFVLRDADGNVTKIWGDPHFNYNGQEKGDFYTTMSFTLDNGTKITVNTTPWGNSGATLSSQLVITRGDQALIVDGMDQNTLGDLSLTMHSSGGYMVDALHDDGLQLQENDATSSGWTSTLTGNDYAQDRWMATEAGSVVREGLEFTGELTAALGAFLLFGSLLPLAGLGAFDQASPARSPEKAMERLFPLLTLSAAIR